MIPLVQNTSERSLPFKHWVPYDIKVTRNYWITYVCQSVSIVAVIFNGSVDSLINGFMIQACAQIDILIHRVHELPYKVMRDLTNELTAKGAQRIEKQVLGEIVQHHNYIIESVFKNQLLHDIYFERSISNNFLLSLSLSLSLLTIRQPDKTYIYSNS
jgi:hypothetical protein